METHSGWVVNFFFFKCEYNYIIVVFESKVFFKNILIEFSIIV